MKMKSCYALAIAALVVLLAAGTVAQVPQMISYQGKISGSSGACLDTNVQMVFSIYPDTISPTSLWSETQSTVVVMKGVFNVLLGSATPISSSIFDGSIRYLGVKMGADLEMTPRKPLVSVGYAMTDGDWTVRGDSVYRQQGYVGIGTASPLSKLDIEENYPPPYNVSPWLVRVKNTSLADFAHALIKVECSSTSNRCQPGIQFHRPDGRWWEISEGAGDYPGDYLGIATAQPVRVVMAFDSLGNVGIGTTQPQSLLHLQDDNDLTLTLWAGNGQRISRIVKEDGNGGGAGNLIIQNDDPGYDIALMTSGGGNVGIGNSNPQYKLDVEGYVQAYGYYTGDIIFQKEKEKLWRMYEDDDGLYLESLKTGKKYRFVLEEMQK